MTTPRLGNDPKSILLASQISHQVDYVLDLLNVQGCNREEAADIDVDSEAETGMIDRERRVKGNAKAREGATGGMKNASFIIEILSLWC